MTILRDRSTTRADFIFYADRLSTLIVEKALSLIPYEPRKVNTPLGVPYSGKRITTDVSISCCNSGLTPAYRWRIDPAIGRSVLSRPPTSYPGRPDRVDAYSIGSKDRRAFTPPDRPATMHQIER